VMKAITIIDREVQNRLGMVMKEPEFSNATVASTLSHLCACSTL